MTPRVLEDKIGRLPLWAQDHIRLLERQRDEAEQRAVAANIADKHPELTNTVLADYVHGDRGLPEDSRIQFRPASKFPRQDRFKIDVQVRGEELYLRAGGPMILRAEVSNGFYVRVEDRA